MEQAIMMQARLSGMSIGTWLKRQADLHRATLRALRAQLPTQLDNTQVRDVFDRIVGTELSGQGASQVVRTGFNALLNGDDPEAAMQNAINAMTDRQRAEFYSAIGQERLVPTGLQRAGAVSKTVLKHVGMFALNKILGIVIDNYGNEYPLDKPKGSDVKVKDWLYGHGGKFTTVRGKNDLISSPATIGSLVNWWMPPPNVRNIDLDSGLGGLVGGDHPLSNFIVENHSKFKRDDEMTDSLGIWQSSDLDFLYRIFETLKPRPGQRLRGSRIQR